MMKSLTERVFSFSIKKKYFLYIVNKGSVRRLGLMERLD